MTEAHRRAKQPERIRQQLLDATLQTVVQQGPHAVTLDAVARLAGVSKGGLQHHFRSKQALLDALFDQLFGDFELRLAAAVAAEPEGPGRHARAYVRVGFDEEDDSSMQRAIALLALLYPAYRERWRDAMVAAMVADGPPGDAADRRMLCRLAADGWWCAQLFESYPPDPQRRDALMSTLLRLCGETPA